MRSLRVCVDASLVLKLVLPEPDSQRVQDLFEEWAREGVELLSPALLFYEVTSALVRAAVTGRIRPKMAFQCLEFVLGLPILLVGDPSLHRDAFSIATELGFRTAYDAHYLALARALGCELWTADRELKKKAGPYGESVKLPA